VLSELACVDQAKFDDQLLLLLLVVVVVVVLVVVVVVVVVWVRGGVVVKALRYKPAGRGFDSRWCHWNFSVI
jgi:flagellar basal body-associated protein FliL